VLRTPQPNDAARRSFAGAAHAGTGAQTLMDELYRDYILDHYKNPKNFGELPERDLEFHDKNPLCGDEMELQIRVEDGKIADLKWHGQGCAISQAAASIASEELIGMPLDDAAKLDADWMLEQMGIKISATRRKCALLNLKVLRGATTGDPSWPE
jgi:nitrogen fixation NifU-like protein